MQLGARRLRGIRRSVEAADASVRAGRTNGRRSSSLCGGGGSITVRTGASAAHRPREQEPHAQRALRPDATALHGAWRRRSTSARGLPSRDTASASVARQQRADDARSRVLSGSHRDCSGSSRRSDRSRSRTRRWAWVSSELLSASGRREIERHLGETRDRAPSDSIRILHHRGRELQTVRARTSRMGYRALRWTGITWQVRRAAGPANVAIPTAAQQGLAGISRVLKRSGGREALVAF